MAALSKTYPSEEEARQAVETLRAAGVPPRHIRLLTGRPLRDARREARGGFAGPVGPTRRSGTYAGQVHRRHLQASAASPLAASPAIPTGARAHLLTSSAS